MKKLAILGSTGSIGQNTLQVAKHLGRESIQVTALAAHSNIDLLEQQAKTWNPELIAVFDPLKAKELKKRIPHLPIIPGIEGLKAVATHSSANFVISAMNGAIGLAPTIEAIKAKKGIGFANKEVLVSGGNLVMSLVKQNHVPLIPIDSELTAIFQCLNGESIKTINRIIITASGGPFRSFTSEQLNHVSVEHALQHPNFRMGPKVTIDSSTLMNKGLEMIETHWLFQVPLSQIEVVIHPQQIIHGMVEFNDNSILAHLCEPDMKVPIQYALTYPNRSTGTLPPFDFLKNHSLEFILPDRQKFRCLDLAYEAAHKGGSLPCYMNAANEVLVNRFLKREIAWKEISIYLEKLMEQHTVIPLTSFDEVIDIDQMARIHALAI